MFDERPYNITDGDFKDGTLYVPAFNSLQNKYFYYSFKLNNNTNKVEIKSFPVETKNGEVATLTKLKVFNNNVFIVGQQGNFACYWKNGKQQELDNTTVKSSFITDFRVFKSL